MPYDEKTLKRDGSGITPVPQHFNPIADDYEPIYGRNNAGRVELYGPDGNPISTSSGKLAVRASEVETLLTTLGSKDYATQTTLAAILVQLGTTASAAVTDPTASAALIQLLKGLLKQLQGGGTGAAPVQLSGSNLAEQKTQADAANNVITFTENISTIEIYHAEPTWQTFTVNGIAITVPAGGYRTPVGGVAAKTVTIPANVNCIVGRLV